MYINRNEKSVSQKKKKNINQSQCYCTVNENKKFKIVTSIDMDTRFFYDCMTENILLRFPRLSITVHYNRCDCALCCGR